MIERFYLRDFLSFKEAELEFSKGLVVFTGPSGSGKSILMSSILASLGLDEAKAGLSEATINFPIKLDDIGIEDDECTVFKQIKKDKVRHFINNQTISKKVLLKLSNTFVRHLSLRDYSDFKNESLLDMIDSFTAQDSRMHQKKLSLYQNKFKSLSELKKELAKILNDEKKVVELREFAEFEISKINTISPEIGEDEELMKIKKELSKKEKIEEAINSAEEIFHYESSVSSALDLLDVESSFFDDAMNELRAHFEASKERLAELTECNIEEILTRIEQISELKHRYGSVEEALKYKDERLKELEIYENLDEHKAILNEKISSLEEAVVSEAKEISKTRLKSLKKIVLSFNDFLKQLYLRPANINLIQEELNIYGQDRVEVELNNTALEKVSAGEFNRLRLALLAVKSLQDNEGGILMLDEIDANLSGEESMSVAKVLSHLSKDYQIFVISHQPQLTSQADQHFFVQRDKYSSVKVLNNEERVNEIARMISGDKITQEAVEFARGLMEEKCV
ncbi:MAG TPA: ATPase [Sulfurimonas sp.]|nr:ATPase [Sulfurimonas sp.]